jgi:hypothetical protein
MGRPPGVPNKSNAQVRALIVRLEKAGKLDFARIVERLQEIALSDSKDRIAAARTLLAYNYGLPRQALDVSHDAGPSVVAILEGIARSDRHRAALEAREQRQLAATTVEPEPA